MKICGENPENAYRVFDLRHLGPYRFFARCLNCGEFGFTFRTGYAAIRDAHKNHKCYQERDLLQKLEDKKK